MVTKRGAILFLLSFVIICSVINHQSKIAYGSESTEMAENSEAIGEDDIVENILTQSQSEMTYIISGDAPIDNYIYLNCIIRGYDNVEDYFNGDSKVYWQISESANFDNYDILDLLGFTFYEEESFFIIDFGSSYIGKANTTYYIRLATWDSFNGIYMIVEGVDLIEVTTKNYLSSVIINEDTFPDIIFRQYISENFDEDQDGILSEREIKNIVFIRIIDQNISSLEGVNNFLNLSYLDCRFNQISILDVSGCINLKTIECSSNQISQLDISGGISLERIVCAGNQLTLLDVRDCINLYEIQCFNNQLTELDVSNCVNLEWLDCYDNQLIELDVSNNTNLIYLCAFVSLNASGQPTNGQLKKINASGCINLLTLLCYNNQLEELNLTGCTSLTRLECGINQLKELDVSDCISLQSLECSGTLLKILDVSSCTNLITLGCSLSGLSSLNMRNCINLYMLNCSWNNLTELDVSDCINLNTLVCAINKINTLDVSSCFRLTELDCSWNNLVKLDVSGCPDLITLDCTRNQLSNLDVTNCLQLKDLYCSDNRLYAIDVSNNNNLYNFNCENNVYQSQSKNIELSILTEFDLSKVIDGQFINGRLNGMVLSPVNAWLPITYLYDTGWVNANWDDARDSSVTFTINSFPAIDDIFTDVPTDIWYTDAVQFVYDHGIMSGKGNGFFDPAGNITRAEFAMTLYSMEDKPEVSYKNTFSDVPDEKWFTNAVLWASQSNIASGYGNGRYGVSDMITREQLALMMYKYATAVCGYEPEIDSGALEKYNDRSKVSSWAVTAMEWAVTNGIISGTGDGRLNPQGNALRCECAQILKSFYKNFGSRYV